MLDPRIGNVHIDANTLDRISPAHDSFVDRLLTLNESGEITLIIPHSVKTEIEHRRTPPRVKLDTRDSVYSLPVQRTAQEMGLLVKLRTLLQGNSQSTKHDADAEHLFEASKYGGRYFITHDRRILVRKEMVQSLIGPIEIVSLEEFILIFDKFVNDETS
jgi:hypothetical protein